MAVQRFGGEWTEDKLSRVAEYLERWNTVLKNQRFTREYIDAFAGTGYRQVREECEDDSSFFPALGEPEVREFLDGSARNALRVQPSFHQFTFIEKSPKKLTELDRLKEEFPNTKIRIERGDANHWVQALCAENWDYRRAVLFLDPFGMQVAWKSLEAVASTRCIDAWILLPLCAGITRNLGSSGDVDPKFRQTMNSLFGEPGWADAFYRPQSRTRGQQSLSFGDDECVAGDKWKVNLEGVSAYFTQRLESIFAGVAKTPVWLKNSKNATLYLLFFVAGNKMGAPIAVKIAESIMRRP